jgi:ABC-2 type transport system ATP-binding protein
MSSVKAIVTKGLTKRFNGLTADDNINLDVEKGEVFGLLGPNGAGKSTLMSMLSTILKPSAGTAEVNGYDIAKKPDEVRKSIGIVFQDPSLDDRLTGKENLEMHAMLYGVPKDARKKRIDDVMELVELKDRANDLVRTYSGGMRRRLEIARGLIHYPKVLFLDEPTIGLDPQTREHIWNYITELAKVEKITIVLTTHYMEEAEALCNRIAIIDNGKIIVMGTPDQLKKSVGGDSIILAVSDLAKAKKAFPNAREFDGKLAIAVKSAEVEIKKVFDAASKAGVEILEANIRKPTLNDVFLRLTGKEIRDEKADSKSHLMDHARRMGMARR